MNSWFQKYKSRMSFLILSGYLLTFSIGAFHFHHIDITFTNLIDNESNPTANHFFSLNGKVNECIIHQNFTSIQTAVTNLLKEYHPIEPEKIIFSPLRDSISISTGYFVSNLLRAPPVFSDLG